MVINTDKDKIEQYVLRMAGANGSVAVQTITYMMMQFLQDEGQTATIQGAKHHLECISDAAHHIAKDPDQWASRLPGASTTVSYDNRRFDERLFAQNYPEYSLYYVNLGRVLKKLDTMFHVNFRVENALNYLQEVEKCAGMLSQDLEQ